MNKHGNANERIQKIVDQAADQSIKKEIPIEFLRAQYLARKNDLVGTLLEKAIERGEFDNLEGAGKPLNLEENPYEGDLHMVHKILKDNGFAPNWIELGKEIDVLRAKFAKEVDYFQKYTRIMFSEKRSSTAIQHWELKKHDFYAQCRDRLIEISKKILDYNLNCPVSLGRANFDVDAEMVSLMADIERLSQA